jgi:hypothetical protein
MAVTGSILASAAFSTAAAAAAGTLIGGYLITHFLVTAAIGLALYALSPKPKMSAQTNRGYSVTQSGAASPHQVVYGKARVAGVRVFDEVTGEENKFLHRVVAFTGHEIDSFDEIYIDDEVITLDGSGNVTSPARYDGFVRIKKHLGTTNQAADTNLVSEVGSWTSAHRLRGIGYLYVRLKYDTEVFPNGVPEITSVIKGKKVYDPRDATQSATNSSTWIWSDNPALCLRDYLISPYGLNEDNLYINDNLFSYAATVCGETSTVAGTYRYTLNGSFLTNDTPIDLIQTMLTSMGGIIWYSQGEWGLKPATWVTPVVSLNEDDARGPIQLSTRNPRRDNFNTVTGTFRGEETNWQVTDFPPVTQAAFVATDNGEEISTDASLSFTDNSIEARRLSRIYLERNRQQLTINANFGLKAFSLRIGDNVLLTNTRFGWTDKEFEVLTWTFGLDGEMSPFVSMTLRETAESVFDEVDDGIVYERDNTNLLDPFFVPTLGLAISVQTSVINERILNVVNLETTANAPGQVDFVEAQYKPNALSSYIAAGTGDLGNFQIVDVQDGIYDFRVRAINPLGVKGEWTTIPDYTVSTGTIDISDVTNLSYNLSGGFITLNWDAVADPGLSYYRIRHALEETSATWANATTAVDKVSRPATSITLPARPGTYFIRAFTKTGLQSENATSIVIPETYLDDFTTTLTQTDSTTFTGTKTDTVVDTGELVLDGIGAEVTFPQDLTNASWTNINSTISANVATPPGEASAYADRINEDTATGIHSCRSAGFPVVVGTTYRVSGKFKSAGRDFVQLNMPDTRFGIDSHCDFDLGNGVIDNTASSSNSYIEDLGDGWYLCGYEMTATSSGALNWVEPKLGQSSGNYNYTGDGSSGVIATDLSIETISVVTGEYEFSTYIDTGSTRRVRSRIDLETRRKDDTSGLFDDLSGNFDSLPGLFDDLTGFNQVSDTDVITYIAVTDDDPAGTPTWSSWNAFQAGEYFGRAFKFKIKLTSTSNNVTPAIDTLTARVQYS